MEIKDMLLLILSLTTIAFGNYKMYKIKLIGVYLVFLGNVFLLVRSILSKDIFTICQNIFFLCLTAYGIYEWTSKKIGVIPDFIPKDSEEIVLHNYPIPKRK